MVVDLLTCANSIRSLHIRDGISAAVVIAWRMPVISRFLGIAIAILYREHDPPHFHAIYGEFEITVAIRDGQVRGKFPHRARGLVLEWLELHRDELLIDWDCARRGEPLAAIPPLD